MAHEHQLKRRSFSGLAAQQAFAMRIMEGGCRWIG
ncbi:hypothetical protein GBFDFA_09915 [Edwardsiella anguillarum]|nr:hypothetical protein GHNJMD_10230 [Edwardsiella anguillarum]BET87812.1 hypothetical protein GBFDFA_09915 [Edwardsiella anguillarum]